MVAQHLHPVVAGILFHGSPFRNRRTGGVVVPVCRNGDGQEQQAENGKEDFFIGMNGLQRVGVVRGAVGWGLGRQDSQFV